jgi:hypothetical protein
MEKRTRGCLWAALGLAVALFMVGVVVVVGGGYWMYQQFAPDARAIDRAGAADELDRIRARFGSQQPLIAVDADDTHARIQREGREPTFTGQLQSIQIAAYDPDDGKLVRFSVPFWLLRLAPDGELKLGDDDVLADVKGAERLTVHELETLGPGLLIDDTRPDGRRVLVWTE